MNLKKLLKPFNKVQDKLMLKQGRQAPPLDLDYLKNEFGIEFPKDFDHDKAWQEGLLIRRKKTFHPQELADRNATVYRTLSPVLFQILYGLICLSLFFLIILLTKLWTRSDHRFFATTLNGEVVRLSVSENPKDLRRVSEFQKADLLQLYNDPKVDKWVLTPEDLKELYGDRR